MQQTQKSHLPAGTRVRLRSVHDFLTLQSTEATVVGPGNAPGLLSIRFDLPARCQFEEDDVHEVRELSESIDNLELLPT